LKLERFEVIGAIASILAMGIFFHYASALDKLAGEPGYHWHMLYMVAGIYARFIPWAIGVGLVIVLFIARVLRRRSDLVWRRFVFALRIFLAYCLLLIVFRVVNFYVPVLHPGIRDDAIQHVDASLFFGQQVSQWLEPIVTPWLTHIMTAAYMAWFWLLFATILLLVFRSEQVAAEYVLASLVAFYTGYVCYVLIPVIGPGYTIHYAVHVGDIAPQFTTERLLIARDCFPSLHTAISTLMVIYVWRYRKAWSVVYIPMAVLIVFATLYLRFHYGLDDIAGIALGIVAASVAPVLQHGWKSRQRFGILDLLHYVQNRLVR
jgi:membrane-associated phospholipid phosphatase